jgi:hypothetical protein
MLPSGDRRQSSRDPGAAGSGAVGHDVRCGDAASQWASAGHGAQGMYTTHLADGVTDKLPVGMQLPARLTLWRFGAVSSSDWDFVRAAGSELSGGVVAVFEAQNEKASGQVLSMWLHVEAVR